MFVILDISALRTIVCVEYMYV